MADQVCPALQNALLVPLESGFDIAQIAAAVSLSPCESGDSFQESPAQLHAVLDPMSAMGMLILPPPYHTGLWNSDVTSFCYREGCFCVSRSDSEDSC